MNTINFIGNKNKIVKAILVEAWSAGFNYKLVSRFLEKNHDTYIPEDQWDAVCKLLNIQLALDIGDRQNESKNSEHINGSSIPSPHFSGSFE